MLGGVRLTVNLTREQTCFAYISSYYRTNGQEGVSIQVQVGEDHVYLWAVFLSSIPKGIIQVHPLLCRLLGMATGRDVYVTTSHNIRTVESLFIEADTNEDQVILEHNQIPLQSVILNQVKLVVANQKAVVWLSPSIPIVFTPQQTGLLVNQSSIIVRINIMDPRAITPQLSPRQEEKQKNSYNATKGLLRPLFHLPKRMALRALPIESDGKRDLIHPYTVFMHEDLVEEKYKSSPLIVALMKSLPSMIPHKNEDEETFWRHELCVEVVAVDSVVFRSLCREVYSEYIPTILIPKSLNKIINVENGTMIMLTFIDRKTLRQPHHIEIITYSSQHQHESELALIERFKSMVVQNTYSGKVFLINHDMVKQNTTLSNGFIKFKLSPDGLAYTTLTQETFRHCTISARNLDQSEMTFRQPIVSMDYDYKNYCRSIKPLELMLERIISHIYFDIHREARFNRCSDLKSSVLVTGLSGTGKSTLCNIVEKEISVFSYILHCRPLKGRKDISSVVAKALVMCTDRKPSLLILDDLDALVPAVMEGLSPQDITSYNGVAVDIKQTLSLSSGVSVLMTARSVADLHPVFRMFTGSPLFTAHFTMPELQQDDRVQLFQHLLNHKVRDHFEVDVDDVIRLAMNTNGNTIRDITDYHISKLFAAIKKKSTNTMGPKPRIVEDVTKDIDKAKAFDIWGPLGGMDNVKEKLNECIFWPLMYPALFPSQGCGILLYGPPGTGKSLVGSCLARLANMNMITIKGPELLSKYIGQSEAAVREVFDKADMKRPCILFFDEFDSLAPKRGHDSTGVTDRVVNQLLARLDGAEGGARGPVVAATSRPDLIDPALLRTGRLSTHIYCELPGVDGRFEVLRTLAKDFHLRTNVDLRVIAEATDGYSPADLKSLLVTAQLSRLDLEILQVQLTDDTDSPTLETVVISWDDINNSLLETKPSLSKEKRKYYDNLYRKFRGEALPNEELSNRAVIPNLSKVDLEQSRMRVTLA